MIRQSVQNVFTFKSLNNNSINTVQKDEFAFLSIDRKHKLKGKEVPVRKGLKVIICDLAKT
jgi:hypothetical protein